MCAERRLKLARASAQFDQSLRCPHEETLHPCANLALKIALREISDQTTRAHAELNFRCANMYKGMFPDILALIVFVNLQSRRPQHTEAVGFITAQYTIRYAMIIVFTLLSADSRRAVVSFWRKNVHNTG